MNNMIEVTQSSREMIEATQPSRDDTPSTSSVEKALRRARGIRERIRESRKINKTLREEARRAISEARDIRQEMQNSFTELDCEGFLHSDEFSLASEDNSSFFFEKTKRMPDGKEGPLVA
jgi:hypothetical protein